MILVDTSVWIELLNNRTAALVSKDDILRFATCAPVMQEVFQGLRFGRESGMFTEAFLALPRLSNPLPWDTFVAAAEIYRQGRRRGYTIRSSIDCLVAAVAIENRVPIWHRDRDFDLIARYTSLEASQTMPA